MQSLHGGKYVILTAEQNLLLNKRTKLINKCQHRSKLKLKNV